MPHHLSLFLTARTGLDLVQPLHGSSTPRCATKLWWMHAWAALVDACLGGFGGCMPGRL